MRVYDTEIKLQLDGGSVEIYEYHDERHGWVGPRRWQARVVVIDDTGVDVVILNRETQPELFQALEQVRDLFESALTAVLDAARSELWPTT